MRRAALAVVLLALAPATAWAGMPSITLTDVAGMRVEAISFFLMVFLLSAWLIQLLWNYLGRDFKALPRLSYPKGVGVTFLWGLLFVLVLTMISGARELMTPGAWEKKGATYKLKGKAAEPDYPPSSTAPSVTYREREDRLEQLRTILWAYAEKHDKTFPSDRTTSGIAEGLWEVPDPSRMRYLYVGGLRRDQGEVPLVYEPGIFGTERMVLLANGKITQMSAEKIQLHLPGKP